MGGGARPSSEGLNQDGDSLFPEGVCAVEGEAWRIMGLPPAPPPHTNWFGHPCTCLALLAELAWGGHWVVGESGRLEGHARPRRAKFMTVPGQHSLCLACGDWGEGQGAPPGVADETRRNLCHCVLAPAPGTPAPPACFCYMVAAGTMQPAGTPRHYPLPWVPHPPALAQGSERGHCPPEGLWGGRKAVPTRLRCQAKRSALPGHSHHHTALADMDPSAGRQVLTSSPFPVVPPGTQGPQLLLGLMPDPGGRGGQRGLG